MGKRSRRVSGIHRARHAPPKVSPGADPGTFLTDPEAPLPPMRVMAYGAQGLVEQPVTALEALAELRREHATVWLNVEGVRHGATVREVGRVFGLHPLALEDVVHTHQRPKVEDYGDHAFVVLRMAELRAGELFNEQLSMFLGKGFVLTFLEDPGDCLDPVRERLRQGRGRLRAAGADYLAYSILDAVLDHYFPVLEAYGERLERLEEALLRTPRHANALELHRLRHDLLALRRAAWPIRDALTDLHHGELALFGPETLPYLRDAADHAVRVLELVETYREFATSLLDIYLSSISNRMNEVMKVLTLIGSIFIPLNFIAALYGMNFNPERSPLNMPELNWYWGYPFALTLMSGVVILMLVFFHKKGWLLDLIRRPRPADERDPPR
jgi:magnesium transporter